MIVEYGKPPISMTNGVPTHLAGEWPGIKSCKFHSYKRVIRPVNHGIFFNENEPPIIPKKKLLGPSPSTEYVHRPCIKIIKPKVHNEQKKESIKCIPYIPLRIEKKKGVRYYFPYVLQKEKEIEKKMKSCKNLDYGRLEMKNSLSTLGFRNIKYEFNNHELLNKIKFSKDIFGNMKIIDNDDEKNYKKQGKKNKKIKTNYQPKIKRNNSVDIDYVNKLNKWDKEDLPQIIDNYKKENKIIDTNISKN